MAELTLALKVDGTELTIALDDRRAPRTAAALLASLPAVVDLHCAKIAGNHLFWHAPFVVPLEAAADVMAAAPGSLLYWPDRQFVELIYGELQAETASVNLLGMLVGDLAPLRALGERLRREQGHRRFDARLEAMAGAAPRATPPPLPPVARLRCHRERMWAAEPAEVADLLARRGVMLPGGPLLMAESEARKLQEQLWLLLMHDAADDPTFAARAACRLLVGARSRLDGLCGLREAGAVLALAGRELAAHPDLAAPLLEEAVLYAGRLAAWLDRRLPWHDLNLAVLTAVDDWA